MLAALTAAHAAGILHRDVKPGNVLLAADSRVVLTDFGIAALHGDDTITVSGAVMGSPAYIAPERARGGPAEPASDLWSLGVTLYAAVEGRTPHERGGAFPTLLAVATEEPDPPQRAGSLAPVLDGLLRRDPAHRLSADDTGRLLRAAASSPDDDTRPAVPPSARPDLASGGRTRVLRLPGGAAALPSTVTSAVPPVTVPPVTVQLPSRQLPSRQLPARQLPSRQLPARQLPSRQLPARQLPARQLPARQVPAIGRLRPPKSRAIRGGRRHAADTWPCSPRWRDWCSWG